MCVITESTLLGEPPNSDELVKVASMLPLLFYYVWVRNSAASMSYLPLRFSLVQDAASES